MFREHGVWTCLFSLFFSAFCIIILAAGCGSSQGPLSVAISPQDLAIGTGQTVQFTPIVTNDASAVSWSASAGTIDASGNYTAPSGSPSVTVKVTATCVKHCTNSASATVNVVSPGQVTPTANTQVASYTISPAAAANVSMQFGTDTNYGFTTWTQPVPTGGGAVSLFVA
jgi:arylsulfate sulfotransferase